MSKSSISPAISQVRDTAQPSPYTHDDAMRDLDKMRENCRVECYSGKQHDRLAAYITNLEARCERVCDDCVQEDVQRLEAECAKRQAALDKAHADLAELREAAEAVTYSGDGVSNLRAVLDRQGGAE